MSSSTQEHFDLSYYLMLLYASGASKFGFLKTIFSAFSSTYDPLDYHMIWHQREILESVGAFSSNDLQVLDMGGAYFPAAVSGVMSLGHLCGPSHAPSDDYPICSLRSFVKSCSSTVNL
ncbi:hypothetical protein Q3G72_028074 [Acer saccharum]|nr:hypothetical protein Q3G72_028074 [Acer saccharum]